MGRWTAGWVPGLSALLSFLESANALGEVRRGNAKPHAYCSPDFSGGRLKRSPTPSAAANRLAGEVTDLRANKDCAVLDLQWSQFLWPPTNHPRANGAAARDSGLRRGIENGFASSNVVGNRQIVYFYTPLPICDWFRRASRSIVAFAPISTSSPISTAPIWGNFQWRPSPKT